MIHIENLKFKYLHRLFLFQGLNLSLEGGRIYGLLGMNGAGKTTLLKIMMRILFPKGGTCHVLDCESRKHQLSMLDDMLFAPEEFYAPDYRKTVILCNPRLAGRCAVCRTFHGRLPVASSQY